MKPEEMLHRACVQYLRVIRNQRMDFWFTHVRNEGKRSIIEGRKMKEMGLKPGTPDLIGCYRGRFFAIELKRPRPKGNPESLLTPTQFTCQTEIALAGGLVTTLDSLDGLADFLETALQIPNQLRRRAA